MPTPRDLGIQVAAAVGSDEHRSERIPQMRERGAQEMTTGCGRMGPKDPAAAPVAVPEGK